MDVGGLELRSPSLKDSRTVEGIGITADSDNRCGNRKHWLALLRVCVAQLIFVNRFDVKTMLVGGMVLLTGSLLLFARALVGRRFVVNVLPWMLLLGFGTSFAFLTAILASITGVPKREAGLSSGLVNTAQQLGGALALAVLASVAASRIQGLVSASSESAAALNGDFHAALSWGRFSSSSLSSLWRC